MAEDRTRRGGALSLAALALVALLLGGCGDDRVSPAPVARAPERMMQAGGAKVAVAGFVGGEDLREPVLFSGQGAIDSTWRRSRLALDVLATPSQPFASGDLRSRQVFDGSVAYLSAPFLERPRGGRRWLELDPARITDFPGVGAQLRATDPRRFIQYLAAATDVKERGEQDLYEVSTRRYVATVDLRRFPGLVPRPERRESQAEVERLARLTGEHELETEVWLDARGLVRKQAIDYGFELPLGGRIRIREEVQPYDFGAPLHVRVPPAEQTVDAKPPRPGAVAFGRSP
jgi:hypothetical protein